ncbi:hypothetical protein K439DRAFT_1614302 [Ramaria rubella]|nr:hypothetical protein K439DRAFT_1614302 [Ramaria rubella]
MKHISPEVPYENFTIPPLRDVVQFEGCAIMQINLFRELKHTLSVRSPLTIFGPVDLDGFTQLLIFGILLVQITSVHILQDDSCICVVSLVSYEEGSQCCAFGFHAFDIAILQYHRSPRHSFSRTSMGTNFTATSYGQVIGTCMTVMLTISNARLVALRIAIWQCKKLLIGTAANATKPFKKVRGDVRRVSHLSLYNVFDFAGVPQALR